MRDDDNETVPIKDQQQQLKSVSSSSLLLSQCPPQGVQQVPSLWESYQSFVRRNRWFLDLADNAIDRLLFWTPHDPDESSQWREVAYGLLSLHRLATDVACQHHIIESYGTSVSVLPLIPGTAIRMALTVTHALLPTVLELSRSNPQQQARRRLQLERIKCALRCILLTSYWFQLYKEQKLERAGLMRDGGMYHPGEVEGPTIAEEEQRQMRREYVGRRTGRRVILGDASVLVPTTNSTYSTILARLLGEALYVYRPLHWAHVEHQGPSTRRDWMTTLGMDVFSLLVLSRTTNNSASRQELTRRKLKLLLYLLRSPIWERYVQASTTRVARGVARVPIVGRLLNHYLMEFVFYWKHPYVSEEG
jgi:Peroxisomal membrane protein (Pex16)